MKINFTVRLFAYFERELISNSKNSLQIELSRLAAIFMKTFLKSLFTPRSFHIFWIMLTSSVKLSINLVEFSSFLALITCSFFKEIGFSYNCGKSLYQVKQKFTKIIRYFVLELFNVKPLKFIINLL